LSDKEISYADILVDIAKERAMKFSQWRRYVVEIKRFLMERLGGDVEVIVFGSVVRGDYVIGLSDIDVLIISEKFENHDIKYKILGDLLTRYGGVFEFHLITPKEKRFYLRFIEKNMLEI